MNLKPSGRHYLKILFVTLFFTAVVISSCNAENDGKQSATKDSKNSEKVTEQKIFKSISTPEAQSLIEKNVDLLIIDVRTPQERKQVRLTNSTLVPIGDVMRGRLNVEKDQPLLVVCAVGGRSYIVSKALIAMGHREIYNLEGGIEAWWRAGYPVETGPE